MHDNFRLNYNADIWASKGDKSIGSNNASSNIRELELSHRIASYRIVFQISTNTIKH